MDRETDVRAAFPELAEIDDGDLRAGVVDAWVGALDGGGVDDINDLRWWPPHEAHLDAPVRNVRHVRDVTACALGLADALRDRELPVDRDVVVAGALLHDVSKCFELEGDETTAFQDWLPHPHYGICLIEAAGLSRHLQHIALAHSDASAVEPRTIEARIVALADQTASDAQFWAQLGSLPGPDW